METNDAQLASLEAHLKQLATDLAFLKSHTDELTNHLNENFSKLEADLSHVALWAGCPPPQDPTGTERPKWDAPTLNDRVAYLYDWCDHTAGRLVEVAVHVGYAEAPTGEPSLPQTDA